MKSRANIKGHPLHQILVSFPIAFFTGGLFFDVLGATSDPVYHRTAVYLVIAGLVTALLAAVPGFIDFLFTVPPRSSAKKRAARHGLTNVAVLILFGIALAYRVSSPAPGTAAILLLEGAGLVLLLVAGWMGGTLVVRNQIGIDPRYAHAGKWKEEYLKPSGSEVEIPDTDALKPDQLKLLHVDGKRIVLARTADGFVAFDDRCTHRGGSLAGGAMMCETIQCPWHGSQFDVRTGKVKAGPAGGGITVYPLEERNGKLYLQLPY